MLINILYLKKKKQTIKLNKNNTDDNPNSKNRPQQVRKA